MILRKLWKTSNLTHFTPKQGIPQKISPGYLEPMLDIPMLDLLMSCFEKIFRKGKQVFPLPLTYPPNVGTVPTIQLPNPK